MKEFRCGDIVPTCDDVPHLDRWPDLISQIAASARREMEAQGLLEVLRERLHTYFVRQLG